MVHFISGQLLITCETEPISNHLLHDVYHIFCYNNILVSQKGRESNVDFSLFDLEHKKYLKQNKV